MICATFVSNSTAFYVVLGPNLLGWWRSFVKDPSPVGMVAETNENDGETKGGEGLSRERGEGKERRKKKEKERKKKKEKRENRKEKENVPG